MDRRTLLDLTRYAALAAVVPNDWRVRLRPIFADDPFTLGVASGDPTPDGVVLWTRLAPRPLEPEFGMDRQRTAVTWELADDDGFRRIVQTGRATAAPELGHSVHIDVAGLQPGREYFYRFRSGDATSPVGRTRTAPATDADAALRFAFASCQNYEQGYFTAYRHMAAESLDLVAHLGDYIYEYSGRDGGVRRHANAEIVRVEDYRLRYAQYKTDADLQAAHAACPWVVTWDDHEVDNNYADTIGENGMESVEQMRARRAAGYQAWWENQPVRVPRAASWADLTIRRAIGWGRTARLWVLDTRQYRSDQPCGDGTKVVPCGDWAAPDRTMLGTAQEQWLARGLAESRRGWQVLAQQVMIGAWDNAPGDERRLSMDQWTGYPAARERLLRTIAERAAGRTVVLTGDIHSNWVHDLAVGTPDRPTNVAAEFVGTSIASGGDGTERRQDVTDAQLAENPQLRWHENRRGYVRCDVTADRWETTYRRVPFVARPDAPIETASRWQLAYGRAGLQTL